MSFLQQSLLWGLFAASIPIIIHLLNRRRHRTVQWAAMEFLLKATRDSRGKKKLKYLIILACRTLAIIALVIAVARPVIGGFFGWGSAKVDTVILILDRSSSMEQQARNSNTSKRTSALTSVIESLQELNNPRLILIDSASNTPQNVPSPDALKELTSTSATDTKASIPALISSAIDYILDNSVGQTEIWIASDMQLSDWAPDQGRWQGIKSSLTNLPTKTPLRILSLNSPVKNNTAIRILSSRRKANKIILDLELVHSEAATATTIPITYSVNGTRSAEKITFNGQSYRFQKHLPLADRAGSGHGFVSIPSDTNQRDNVAFYAYGEDTPTLTYLISEGGEAADWLSLASAPPGFEQSQSIRISPGNTHEVKWSNASLIIWQAPLPEGTIAQQFSRYIENGGAAIILPPRGESDITFLGMRWGKQSASPRGQYFIIEDWDMFDGPLKNGLDGTSLPVPKLKAIRRRDIDGESTLLAAWDDAQPFLSRRVLGDGTAIFITTLPDYTWSNLADADVLLPVVQRMIAKGDNRFSSSFTAIAGTQKSHQQNGEIRSRLDTYSKSTSANAPYEAGVWKLGDRLLASNRPQSEDTWQILSNNNLTSLLEGTHFTLFEDKGQSKSLAREIWRAFLIIMIMLLIIEATLCLQPKPARIS